VADSFIGHLQLTVNRANISAHLHLSATAAYGTPTLIPNIPNWKNYLCCVYVIVCYISARIKKRVILLVLTAITTKFIVLFDVMPCSLVNIYRRFRGACCFQHLRRPKKLYRFFFFSKTMKHISQSIQRYFTEDGYLLIQEAA